jgi:two-component system phosphate regulon sensor histidine kinase PhoR
MRRPIIAYLVIAVISFVILSVVQFKLVQNTYQLENERYYYAEKSVLNKEYSEWIRNDKLFPGGQAIIDSILVKHIPRLDQLYLTDKAAFEQASATIIDSIIQALRSKECVRAFLHTVQQEKGIKDSLEYALMLSSLEMLSSNQEYVPLFENKKNNNAATGAVISEEKGIRIGGQLQNLIPQNVVTALTVSSARTHSSLIRFELYVEPLSRAGQLFSKMALIYGLCLFSFLVVVSLFFITFRNWLRQKKLSEMKSDFINNITHEFHTPLSAIIVANKSLQNERIIANKDNIRPLAEIIQRQSERLKTLIGQVLDIVSMQRVQLRKKEQSVHHLLDEILLDYRLQSAENFVLTYIKNAEKDTVPLDSFYFTTMLLNILDNAVKYNNSERKEITVATQSDSHELQIVIKDNGIGMTKETIRHIFDKFYRHTNNLFSQTKGLGLGLYYVKQAVLAHNWKIYVDSKPGVGSRFDIHIPFQDNPA